MHHCLKTRHIQAYCYSVAPRTLFGTGGAFVIRKQQSPSAEKIGRKHAVEGRKSLTFVRLNYIIKDMKDKICGIILKVSYPAMGDTSTIEIIGKTMLEWVALSFGDSPYSTVTYSDSVALPVLVRPYVDRESEFTVVLYSDTPLITRKTVLDAVCTLEQSDNNVLKMTRGYVFRTPFLLACEKLYTENHQYFDEEDFMTAFSFKQTAMVSEALKNRILSYHMQRGVQIEDPASTFIGCDAVIGKGVVISPFNTIKGKTIIKDNVRLDRGNILDECIIDEGAVLSDSRLYSSYVGKNTTVGPFAYVRPKSLIGDDCRIGDFVEIKNSVIGSGTKIAHLTYVGDAEIGKHCNIGCGVVFVNYDGKTKKRSKVGDDAFIGSNVNIIAPVQISGGAFIAAGSTVTDDVPADSLAIARARQVIKPDWVKNKRQ